jgi:hypothetical protein
LDPPVPIIGGLSGAAGGFAEACAESSILGKGPSALAAPRVLASQSVRLFSCFGTYTYLSRAVSPDVSLSGPFALCWVFGSGGGRVWEWD